MVDTNNIHRIYITPYNKHKNNMRFTQTRGQLYVSMLFEEFECMIGTLLQHIPVDHDWYLQQYPDVAAAVSRGEVKSAREHFSTHGYFEGRWPSPIAVSEAWYLAEYPEIARAIEEGTFDSAQAHFEQHGYQEGRPPWAREDNK